MPTLKHVYCRAYQAALNLATKALPWRKAIRVEGAGSVCRLPQLLRLRRAFKPMVVTGPSLVKKGVASRALDALTTAGIPYVLFDAVEADPSIDTVDAIYERYLAQRCDSIIAIGGGSPMDAAKAAGARVAMPGKTVPQLGGLLKVWHPLPLFIAVPTTAGTGSETTIAAVVTNSATHHKYALMDLHLMPRYAVLDPELTTGLPPAVTAATGMDALTHAVEAYLCQSYNTDESLRYAEEAVAGVFKALPAAFEDGCDLRARATMQTAAYKAGFAFTRAGVGNVHAIAHAIGGLYHIAHGLAVAVTLPVVLEDYGPAVHPKLARLARLAGLSAASDDAVAAKAFIMGVRRLNSRFGFPAGFGAIQDADISQMATWAEKEANPLYPVPIIYDAGDFRRIIQLLRLRAAADNT